MGKNRNINEGLHFLKANRDIQNVKEAKAMYLPNKKSG